MRLSQMDIDNYVEQIMQNDMTLDKLMQTLRAKGIPEEEIKPELQNINNHLKKRLAQAKLKAENDAGNASGGIALMFIVSFVGIMIESIMGHLIILVIMTCIGYFTNKDNRWAVIIGGIVFHLAGLVVHPLYFSGRTHFLKIELLVVAAICAVPAYLTALLITKIQESNEY
jgi:hypothetical protein